MIPVSVNDSNKARRKNGNPITTSYMRDTSLQVGKGLTVRCVDEEGDIVFDKISLHKGVNQVDCYRLVSELGFEIILPFCSLIESNYGLVRAEDVTKGLKVSMNGNPLYRDKDWLNEMYHERRLTQAEMAKLANCSTHTIKKWIAINGLQTNSAERLVEWHKGKDPFGKGLTKDTHPSLAERGKKVSKAVKGTHHKNKRAWIEKPTVSATSRWQARHLIPVDKCKYCSEEDQGNLHVHHIDKNHFNNDVSNLMCLCSKHHSMIHGSSVYLRKHFVALEEVSYVGKQDTILIDINKAGVVISQFVLPKLLERGES